MNRRIARIAALGFLVLSVTSVSGQETVLDYNSIYRFPVSLGAEYQNLKYFIYPGVDVTSASEISLSIRSPLPFMPVLQPFVHLGMMPIVTNDPSAVGNEGKWNHTHWFATTGLGYIHRFSKSFEMGVDLGFGLSEAVFPNLDPPDARGSPTLIGTLGGRVALNPSYSMSIDVHPTVRYFHSFTPLTKFNGFIYGIGFSVSYRLGEDPDSPQAIIRSIKLAEGDSELPDLFAAMQSYYVDNPVGSVTVTNREDFALTDVEVSLFQSSFMDSPTKCATIPILEAGESRTVDVYASFNGKVFETEGITPVAGEYFVEYVARGRPARQTFPVEFDLYDKEALTWDDDKKVAALITPADSALRNYSNAIRGFCKDYEVDGLSDFLQAAMEIYHALTELGIIYQIDLNNPFTSVKENPRIVDSVSLPRNTLTRLAGDCDDLTVMYCALLETLGIDTGFITVPGHIFAAFNTGVAANAFNMVHPDKNMSLNLDGELWVPVEPTMIGEATFLDAWRTGIEEYRALDDDPDNRMLHRTQEAQQTYRPVGLLQEDLGLQYGNSSVIQDGFKADLEKLIDAIVEHHLSEAQESGHKGRYNRLGIICAQFGRYLQAEKAFNTALSLDRNYADPKINLGTLAYIRNDYQDALRIFHGLEETLGQAGERKQSSYVQVLLNISRSYYELENYEKASEYYERVIGLDPSKKEKFAYLQSSSGEGRAAQVGGLGGVQFVEEEP